MASRRSGKQPAAAAARKSPGPRQVTITSLVVKQKEAAKSAKKDHVTDNDEKCDFIATTKEEEEISLQLEEDSEDDEISFNIKPAMDTNGVQNGHAKEAMNGNSSLPVATKSVAAETPVVVARKSVVVGDAVIRPSGEPVISHVNEQPVAVKSSSLVPQENVEETVKVNGTAENDAPIAAVILDDDDDAVAAEELVEAPSVEGEIAGAPPVEEDIAEPPLVEQELVEAPSVEEEIAEAPQVEEGKAEAVPVEEENASEAPLVEEKLVEAPAVEEQFTKDAPVKQERDIKPYLPLQETTDDEDNRPLSRSPPSKAKRFRKSFIRSMAEDVDTTTDDDRSRPSTPIVTKSGRRVQQTQRPYQANSETSSPIPPFEGVPMEEQEGGVIMVPVDTHIETSDKMREYEESNPPVFCPGDLMWARVGSAPYWPCVVTRDPDLPLEIGHTKIKMRGIDSCTREYHVHFYGKQVQRAWVSLNLMFPNAGRLDFEQRTAKFRADIAKKPLRMRVKLMKAYSSTGRTKKQWEEAVRDYEKCVKMTAEERLTDATKRLATLALIPPKKSPPPKAAGGAKKRGRPFASAANDSFTGESDPKRLKGDEGAEVATLQLPKPSSRFVEADRLIESIPTEVLEKQRRKLKTGYKLFHLAMVEEAKKKADDKKPEKDQGDKVKKESPSEDKVGEKDFTEKSEQVKEATEEESVDKEVLETMKEMLEKIVANEVNKALDNEEKSNGEMILNEKEKTVESDKDDKASEIEAAADKDPKSDKLDNNEKSTDETSQDKVGKEETVKPESIQLSDKALVKRWNALSAAERCYYAERVRNMFDDEDRLSAATESSIEDDVKADDAPLKPAKKPAESTKTVVVSKKDEMVGLFKKENCCVVCEETAQPKGDLIKCRGTCNRAFHKACLKPGDFILSIGANGVQEWKCQECRSGLHKCQLCNTYETTGAKGPVLLCSFKNCGRYFHASCLKENGLWPQCQFSEKALTCPAHICHTCASDNPRDPYMKFNTPLLKCLRCPTAYHSGDTCVTAGSVQITATHIICPKHYRPKGSKSGGGHINASWCFICSEGGDLVCCERCPGSFHPSCLKLPALPEGKFFCDNCESGRMPLYGEVVWAKLGSYRWWPAQVLYPHELPGNIERLPHETGQFPVQFCGTKEYVWMDHGRCFLYEQGDSDRVPGSGEGGPSKALNQAFQRAVIEAADLFEKHTAASNARIKANEDKVRGQKGLKPPLFTRIKTNRPVGDVPVYTADPLDLQVCDCKIDDDNPCGQDSDCINRLLMTECLPTMCRAKERCQNQRFQRRNYPKVDVTRTRDKGWGLCTKNAVKKGTFMIEYVGELITMNEFHRRVDEGLKKLGEEMHFYYMMMDSSRMIDAGPKGNIARFMNHSCDPNCETQKWTVNGDTRVGLFALKDLPEGTELTFNYQFESMGDQKKPCLCGAKNCSGFIGVKPLDKEAVKELADLKGKKVKPARGAKRKREEKTVKKVWEDLCFRCWEDGELLMCDWKTCPKVYHLTCLGREKMPREKWYCPWHHCVACGKPAVAWCMHCPNAYCKTHKTVPRTQPELGTICDEHEDDLADTVAFYRALPGGIENVVPHPNVPLEVLDAKKRSPSPEPASKQGVPLANLSNLEDSASVGKNRRQSALTDFYSSENLTEFAPTTTLIVKDDHDVVALVNGDQQDVKPFVNGDQEDVKPFDNGQFSAGKRRRTVAVAKMYQSGYSSSADDEEERDIVGDRDIDDDPDYKPLAVAPPSPSDDFDYMLPMPTPFRTPSSAKSKPRLSSGGRKSSGKRPSSGVGGNAKKYHCKCIELDCEWRGRKSRLHDHLRKRHGLSEEDCKERVRFVLNSMMNAYAENKHLNSEEEDEGEDGSPMSKYKRGKETLKICPDPDCRLKMRASNLVRHIKTKHPNCTPEQVEMALHNANKDMEAEVPEFLLEKARLKKAIKLERPSPVKTPKAPKPFVPEPLVTSPPEVKPPVATTTPTAPKQRTDSRRVECPQCWLALRPQMYARHWRSRHPHLPMPDLKSCKPIFLTSSSSLSPFPNVSNIKKEEGSIDVKLDDEEVEMCSTKKRHSLGSLHFLARGDPQHHRKSASKTPKSVNGKLRFKCDTPGCDYASSWRQNLDRHCRQRSHYSQILIQTSKRSREDMLELMAKDNLSQPSEPKDGETEQPKETPIAEGEPSEMKNEEQAKGKEAEEEEAEQNDKEDGEDVEPMDGSEIEEEVEDEFTSKGDKVQPHPEEANGDQEVGKANGPIEREVKEAGAIVLDESAVLEDDVQEDEPEKKEADVQEDEPEKKEAADDTLSSPKVGSVAEALSQEW